MDQKRPDVALEALKRVEVSEEIQPEEPLHGTLGREIMADDVEVAQRSEAPVDE